MRIDYGMANWIIWVMIFFLVPIAIWIVYTVLEHMGLVDNNTWLIENAASYDQLIDFVESIPWIPSCGNKGYKFAGWEMAIRLRDFRNGHYDPYLLTRTYGIRHKAINLLYEEVAKS